MGQCAPLLPWAECSGKEQGGTRKSWWASAGMGCCVSSTGVFVQGWLLWGLHHVRLRGLSGVFVSLLTPLLYQSKATDPGRFTNRGGNLLKEEKQRAKLQKTLSRVGPALGKDLWSH